MREYMKARRSHSSSSTCVNITALHAWMWLAAATFIFLTACRLVTGEITPTEEADIAPDLPTLLATPVAQSPAAGICGKVEGDIVTLTIYPDIPDPRCVIITSEQKLRVINRRAEQLQVAIGRFAADIAPDGEFTFEMPVGEYLMPGVHLLQVSPCCSPELWLKSNFP